MNNFVKIETITILVITLMGILQGEVTVFYIVYLFWFQELTRTIIDFFYLIFNKSYESNKGDVLRSAFSNMSLLFVYFVFIVVLFGFMLNWNNKGLLGTNFMIIIFKNWFFNINILLFAVQYSFYRREHTAIDLKFEVFNSRHIVLHLSIILGALLQMIVAPKISNDNMLTSTLVILPFLCIKMFIDKRKNTKSIN